MSKHMVNSFYVHYAYNPMGSRCVAVEMDHNV